MSEAPTTRSARAGSPHHVRPRPGGSMWPHLPRVAVRRAREAGCRRWVLHWFRWLLYWFRCWWQPGPERSASRCPRLAALRPGTARCCFRAVQTAQNARPGPRHRLVRRPEPAGQRTEPAPPRERGRRAGPADPPSGGGTTDDASANGSVLGKMRAGRGDATDRTSRCILSRFVTGQRLSATFVTLLEMVTYVTRTFTEGYRGGELSQTTMRTCT